MWPNIRETTTLQCAFLVGSSYLLFGLCSSSAEVSSTRKSRECFNPRLVFRQYHNLRSPAVRLFQCPFCFLVIVLQFSGLGSCCSPSMSAPAPAAALAASSAAIAFATAPVVTPPAPTPSVAFSPVDAAPSSPSPAVVAQLQTPPLPVLPFRSSPQLYGGFHYRLICRRPRVCHTRHRSARRHCSHPRRCSTPFHSPRRLQCCTTLSWARRCKCCKPT